LEKPIDVFERVIAVVVEFLQDLRAVEEGKNRTFFYYSRERACKDALVHKEHVEAGDEKRGE
jgi:hypothetical protein